MKKVKPEQDELRAEYRREDFSTMVRGKYAQRCREKSNVVVISPDVQKAFPDAQARSRIVAFQGLDSHCTASPLWRCPINSPIDSANSGSGIT